uniref:Uncharacterized protein n=1 Tax=Quercus lobata TaxID=97700 RepID=A0A7N2M7K0_QUELO
MMTYLTNVWRLNLTHAAAIVNMFTGAATIMPIVMACLVNSFMGDFWMLLLSSLAYSFGMSFLAMSTPPVLSNVAGNCSAYKPDCIGDAQKVLFYTALALIAIGISGHITSLESFLKQHMENPTPWQVAGGFGTILFPIVGCIALPYIKPCSVRFGIPAICTVVATFLFICGSCSEKHSSKEEEDTKISIRMIPMWMTFIMCGVVISIGNTYFLEQAKNMNHKVGILKVPLPIFKIFYDLVKDYFTKLCVKVNEKFSGKYLASCGVMVAMLFSILCCITAAKMETRRLDVIRRHCLPDKPNGKIPMSMFLLLPQYLLLRALDGISNFSIDYFFTDQVPASMKHYS